VRRNPPQVIEALREVRGTHGEEREDVLAALLGLVDPVRAYEEALGMYDLELAMHVAQVKYVNM
jgi:hypothetical protein